MTERLTREVRRVWKVRAVGDRVRTFRNAEAAEEAAKEAARRTGSYVVLTEYQVIGKRTPMGPELTEEHIAADCWIMADGSRVAR